MLIKRNQQPVWVHTEREAPRAPRQRRLSRATSPSETSLQVIKARRPFQSGLGRCLAIRLVPMPAGPALQVLVAHPNRTTTWFDAEKALTERQADAWARSGF